VATFFARGDKTAESGDVDYEYHHITKGLYATLFIVAYRPLSFSREVRVNICC